MERQIAEVVTILKDAVANATPGSPMAGIKQVFTWDPVIIWQSVSPCLIVTPTPWAGLTISSRGTRQDETVQNITIFYIINLWDTIWVDNQEEVLYQKNARLIFADTDVNNVYTQDSIIWLLRKNFTINWTVDIQNTINVTFNFANNRGWITFEASLAFDLRIVSKRSQ